MKMLMTQYTYQVTQLPSGGVHVDLYELATKRMKRFFVAAPNSLLRLYEHMNTLTDDLCEQWLKEKSHKPKKEKK